MRTNRLARRRRIFIILYVAGLLIPLALLSILVWTVLRTLPPDGDLAPASTLGTFKRNTPSLTLAGDNEETPWYLRLVNSAHPLPEGWDPDLAVIDAWTGEKFDSRALEHLQAMLEAMEEEGMHPLVCSGYRSYESQVKIFRQNVEDALAQGYTCDEAEKQAALWVMPPGCSEHQSALAADIVSEDNQNLDESQDHTPEQQWLHAHCQEYGFILRYPKDKTELTGVNYEPWHYRYVGAEAAADIMAHSLCLEEYTTWKNTPPEMPSPEQ